MPRRQVWERNGRNTPGLPPVLAERPERGPTDRRGCPPRHPSMGASAVWALVRSEAASLAGIGTVSSTSGQADGGPRRGTFSVASDGLPARGIPPVVAPVTRGPPRLLLYPAYVPRAERQCTPECTPPLDKKCPKERLQRAQQSGLPGHFSAILSTGKAGRAKKVYPQPDVYV